MFKKISPLFAALSVFILAFLIASAVLPDKTFSENENKMLATMPEVGLERIIDGRFETGYENYVADQFPLRDGWIGLKSIAEFILMKGENNGIVYGSDGYLFAPVTSVDETQKNRNITALSEFSEKNSNVSLMIVPSSDYILSDKMPSGYPSVDQEGLINEIYGSMPENMNIVDLRETFSENAYEYIYYRTDHHWTTYGAYLAYIKYTESRGINTVDLENLTADTVDDFLGTSYSKAKNFNVEADRITYYEFPAKITVNGQDHDSIYNIDQFTKRDKYAGFLWGNSPESEIVNPNAENKNASLLVIRDSYADCFVPFLSEYFGSIKLIDMRYYRGDIQILCDSADEILILYGFSDIISDVNIPQLSTTD